MWKTAFCNDFNKASKGHTWYETQEALKKDAQNLLVKKEKIQLSMFVSDADFDFCHRTTKKKT